MSGHVFSPNNYPFVWGIWAPSNTWFLESTQVHSPNGISIGSAVFAQFTVECHRTYRGIPFPSKLPLPTGICTPHLTRGSLGPPNWASQTESQLDQPFLNSLRQKVVGCRKSLNFTTGAHFPKTAPSHGGIWTPSIWIGSSRFCTDDRRVSLYFTVGRPLGSGPHLIHGSHVPPESSTQTASQLVNDFCRVHYCDRPTDRPHYHTLVTIGLIYVRHYCDAA